MSAPICSHPLRARVAEALSDVLSDHPASEVARWVGIDRATPARRGADLSQWPAADLLSIAAEDPSLRAALIACLQGQDAEPIGEAVHAVRLTMAELQRDGVFIGHIAEYLADGRISPDEARKIEAEIMATREQQDAELLPVLRAVQQRVQG